MQIYIAQPRRYSFWFMVGCLSLCSMGVLAQSTMNACLEDYVMLRLTGFKQGITDWQESPDIITWTTASGTHWNDSLGFTVQKTRYYRAVINEGFCDSYVSDWMKVKSRPYPSTAMAPSNISQTSFTAHWTSSGSASDTNYILEIARNSDFTFASQTFTVFHSTNLEVNDLICDTRYYYRIKYFSDSCQRMTHWSNIISVKTSSCPPPVECTVPSSCNGDVTDSRDGRTYKTIQIGTQCWMKENLNVGKRIDGIIPQSPGDGAIEKYCYEDNEANCNIYGGIYLWDEMMAYGSSVSTDPGPQGICPAGWHIPTDNEFVCLEKALGGASVAGGKLKDTSFWDTPNAGATNSSGFSALPAGLRDRDGSFINKGKSTHLWSATEEDSANGIYRYQHHNNVQLIRYNNRKLIYGYSVRCVKNATQ